MLVMITKNLQDMYYTLNDLLLKIIFLRKVKTNGRKDTKHNYCLEK